MGELKEHLGERKREGFNRSERGKEKKGLRKER